MAYKMNPNWHERSADKEHEAGESREFEAGEQEGTDEHEPDHAPHIHFQPHHNADGEHTHTTVHVLHDDGRHEKHTHAAGDTEGMASHIDEHYGQQAGGPLEAENSPASENEPEIAL